jgi:hypothetical protein
LLPPAFISPAYFYQLTHSFFYFALQQYFVPFSDFWKGFVWPHGFPAIASAAPRRRGGQNHPRLCKLITADRSPELKQSIGDNFCATLLPTWQIRVEI